MTEKHVTTSDLLTRLGKLTFRVSGEDDELDNHHNAACCPYCGEIIKEAVAIVQQRAEQAEVQLQQAVTALRAVLDRVPREISQRRVLIDPDPAGSTYDEEPHDWYTQAMAVLAALE